MTLFAICTALLAQAVAPAPAKAPRSLTIYEVDSRPTSGHESNGPPAETTVVTGDALDLKQLLAQSSDLGAFLEDFLPSNPTARLLASLVEEEARTFDPTVRCVARGSMVLLDSVASEEAHVRELLKAASASSRERSVQVEIGFMSPGPKSIENLKRSGIECDAKDGAARVQGTNLTPAEIGHLLVDDGEIVRPPALTVPGGHSFSIRTWDDNRSKRNFVTDWDFLWVEELGDVVVPKITTLETGLHVQGTALIVSRPAERGGDRIALDLDVSILAVGTPIPTEKRVVHGKEVTVQLPTVKQTSLHALVTLAPEQRVLVAGLARPTFKSGEAVRPVLLEVVARGAAKGEGH